MCRRPVGALSLLLNVRGLRAVARGVDTARKISSLHLRRGRGVLVVEHQAQCRELLTAELLPLEVDVYTASSAREALAFLKEGSPVEVLITDHQMPGMSGSELIQRVRAEAVLATTYIIMLTGDEALDSATALGQGADEYIQKPHSPLALRASVRAGLRAQAHRRVLARRERRRAVEWLSAVVAHELNNPLSAAMAGMEVVSQILGGHGLSSKDHQELQEITLATRALLDRIRTTAHRLTRGDCTGANSVVEEVQADALLEHILATVEQTVGVSVHGRCGSRAHERVVVDRGLLQSTVARVVGAGRRHCSGEVQLTLHMEDYRVAVIVEIGGAPDLDPEIILEPRLTDGTDGPARFDPALSAVEASFARGGGQIFARPSGSQWRFGLTLPVCTRRQDALKVASNGDPDPSAGDNPGGPGG